jgi:hypothetical protein
VEGERIMLIFKIQHKRILKTNAINDFSAIINSLSNSEPGVCFCNLLHSKKDGNAMHPFYYLIMHDEYFNNFSELLIKNKAQKLIRIPNYDSYLILSGSDKALTHRL